MHWRGESIRMPCIYVIDVVGPFVFEWAVACRQMQTATVAPNAGFTWGLCRTGKGNHNCSGI